MTMTIDIDVVVKGIAQHLEGWDHRGQYPHYAYLVHTESGTEIGIRLDKGRLELRGYVLNYWGSSEVFSEASLSATREGKVLAREIERRVLPGLVEAYQEGRDKLARKREESEEQAAWLLGLCAQYESVSYAEEQGRRLRGVSFRTKEAHCDLEYPPNASSVSLQLHWLTRAQAEAVMAALLSESKCRQEEESHE